MPKFYVTMTWHDWPEGGSYGTVVEAKDHDEAHRLTLEEMATSYGEECGTDIVHEDYDWFLVDCFKLSDFHNHREALKLLDSLLERDDVIIDSAAADVVEKIKELLQ